MTSPVAEAVEPPRIRILKASHIYSVGRAIVVLEWRQNPMGALAVDYWILIPEPSCELREGRYDFEVLGAEGAEPNLLVDSVQESCRSWLQSQIADELVRKQPNLASLWPVVELKPANDGIFLSAWMKEKCDNAIERLSTRVHDVGLRHFLYLLRSIKVTKRER